METLTTCPFCGQAVPAQATFCRHCGEDIAEPKPEWQQPGSVRRDCESHRGGLLLGLAVIGVLLAFLHVLAVIGLPLCVAVWRMSREDLRKMQAGLMDPRGLANTRSARQWGVVGMIIGSMWLVVFFFVLLAVSWG
jgi:hypothetical protein